MKISANWLYLDSKPPIQFKKHLPLETLLLKEMKPHETSIKYGTNHFDCRIVKRGPFKY